MLKDLQHGMLKVITSRAGVEAAVRELGDEARALEAAVAGDARLGSIGRLQIYADMYAARLRSALASIYPVLERLMGCEGFTTLSSEYFDAHPSRHPSLRWVGRELPSFLDGWAADMAALEWARHDVFDAADEELLDGAAIAALGPEGVGGLVVRLIGAHRLVAVGHAIEPIWRGETEEAEPAAGELLVWREGATVYHRRIGEDEAAAVRAAAAGLTFAALCERMAERVGMEEAPRVAGELVGRWLKDQLLAR